MADIKVNEQTGEIAVQQGGGWKIYKPGEYKFNAETKQYAVPVGGKWRVLGGVARDGHADMTAKAEEAIRAEIDQGPLDAALLALGQGGMFGYGDEIFGGIEALRGNDYTNARNFARATMENEANLYPKTTTAANIAGNIATGVPAAIATGATSFPAVVGVGMAEGALGGYGRSNATDLDALKNIGIDAAISGVGSAAGYGLGKLIEKFTARGLAAETIQKALDGNTDELMARVQQLGGSPAEADEVLREVLRGQAAKNPTAAAAAVPAAQERLAAVNAQNIDDVSRIVSPDNATALIESLQQQGQAIGRQGYGAAYANPATVGLVPEIANNPAMADALKAAEKLAAAQGRPFDVTNLGVQDLDAIQRALSTSSQRMFDSTPENTLLGPVYDDLATGINKMAGNMAPELAETQASYAAIKGAQEAVELGKKALDPSKEFVEVAEEFAKLSPQAQEAYRAGVATRLRTMLQSKAPTANTGQVFNRGGVIEKLKAVGFPEEEIEAIIERSGAARGVLDSLQGGSDTARKLAAAAASESPMTKIKPSDLAAAALVHPSTLFALPMLRAGGMAQERQAAGLLINALTEQGGAKLQGLLAHAPQRLTPLLGLLAGSGANQIGQPR